MFTKLIVIIISWCKSNHYALNLHSAVCQLYLNKTGRRKSIFNVSIPVFSLIVQILISNCILDISVLISMLVLETWHGQNSILGTLFWYPSPPDMFITPVFPISIDDSIITQLLPSLIPHRFAGPGRDSATHRAICVCVCVCFLRSWSVLIFYKNWHIVYLQYCISFRCTA